MKSFSREQNCTPSEIVNLASRHGALSAKGLASRGSLPYMGSSPSEGAAGMKEPRKSPPRRSPTKSEEKLDEELEESFPASDPPSNTPTSAGGPERSEAKHPKPDKPPRRG